MHCCSGKLASLAPCGVGRLLAAFNGTSPKAVASMENFKTWVKQVVDMPEPSHADISLQEVDRDTCRGQAAPGKPMTARCV
jgi:hypothetical protein